MDPILVATQQADGLMSAEDKIKLDFIYPKTLNINNDFTIWQRAPETGIITCQNGDYCADMWRVYLNNASRVTLERVAGGGIRVVSFEGENADSSVNLYQLDYSDDYYENLKCTVSYSINGEHNFYHRILGNNFEGSNNQKFCSLVSINELKQGDVLDYVDLFEGDTYYNHRKQKYYDNMYDCWAYYQRLSVNDISTALNKVWGNARSSVLSCMIPLVRFMKGRYIIKDTNSMWIYCNDSSTSYTMNTLDLIYSLRNKNNILCIYFTLKDGSLFKENNYCFSFNGEITIDTSPI